MGFPRERLALQNVGVAGNGTQENPRTIADGEMTRMNTKRLLTNLWKEDGGQDLIEYALVASLLALAAVSAMSSLTNKIDNAFNRIGNSL